MEKIHEAILASAEATTKLADALTNSVLRQGRGIRNWMIGLSLAVIVVGAVVIWGRVEGIRTGETVRNTNQQNAELLDCLQDEQSDCFTRLRLNEKVVTDADRQLLAQEIMCVGFRLCPPGMTPENVPDLDGLVFVPEPEDIPTGTTTPE